MAFYFIIFLFSLPLLITICAYLVFVFRWGEADKSLKNLPPKMREAEFTKRHFISIAGICLSVSFVTLAIDGIFIIDDILFILAVALSVFIYKYINNNLLLMWNLYLGSYADIYNWIKGPYNESHKFYRLQISKWMSDLKTYNDLRELFLASSDWNDFNKRALTLRKNSIFNKFFNQFLEINSESSIAKNLYNNIRVANEQVQDTSLSKFQYKEVFPYETPVSFYDDLSDRAIDHDDFKERIQYWFIVKLKYWDLVFTSKVISPKYHTVAALIFSLFFFISVQDKINVDFTMLAAASLYFGIAVVTTFLAIYAGFTFFSQKGSGVLIKNLASPKKDDLIQGLTNMAIKNSASVG